MFIWLAGQAPVSGHLSLTPLAAAYENHSHKWPAPVTDTFFVSRGVHLRDLPLYDQILFFFGFQATFVAIATIMQSLHIKQYQFYESLVRHLTSNLSEFKLLNLDNLSKIRKKIRKSVFKQTRIIFFTG